MSRILTGDRPTGALHLGHYFGTLANRVGLQRHGHEVFVVVADYQVLTDRDHGGSLRNAVVGLVLDYLACGLDPEDTIVFAHSAVPALNQLMLPFLSIVTIGELSRNPTVKDEIRLRHQRSISGLITTYPVHQAADVLFCKADLVRVGNDQLPHLELTRAIARRFNARYGEVFTLPVAMLGQAPRLRGLDGRKMSKSLGNAIALTDGPDVVTAKIRGARTDAERTITYEPERRPEVANLLQIAALCTGSTPDRVAAEVSDGGASMLKRVLTDAVCDFLRPIQQRRDHYTVADALNLLEEGGRRANAEAEATLRQVRCAMGMSYTDGCVTVEA